MNFNLLGCRIREKRMSQHMSQEKLAEMVDVSVTYIGAIENARKHPSLTTLVNIANALETTPDFLLSGSLYYDTPVCKNEFSELLQDCSLYERTIIMALAKFLKSVLRENGSSEKRAD